MLDINTQQVVSPNMLPGPFGLPFIGHMNALMKLVRDPVKFLSQHYAAYGALSGLTHGRLKSGSAVLALGPEYNYVVFSNPTVFHTINVNKLRDSALKRLNSGLVNMNGAIHQQQRRLMMPAFHKKAVESYRDTMVTQTSRMLDRWHPGEVRDMAGEMRALVMQIISKALFGLDEHDNTKIAMLVAEWLQWINSPRRLMWPISRFLLEKRSQSLERAFLALIAQKRANPGSDVLSTLIAARDEDGATMTDANLIGQTSILFVAGHETTINTLTWIMFLLAVHPTIAADLFDELDSVLHGEAPTVEQLRDLPLLDWVIKEALRLFPPLCFTMRMTAEPVTLGQYDLPKDVMVIVSHYLTHRLPHLYPQPEQFNPMRWESIDPSPYEYIPFSAGPRLCIGATFATMEMKIILAMLLQCYRLTLLENKPVNRGPMLGTMIPKNGLSMKIQSQDRQFGVQSITGTVRDIVVW